MSRALGPFLALCIGGGALAQTPGEEPPYRMVYRNLLVLRANPLGLIDDARISYRHRLYRSDSAVARDNFVGIGLAPSASPAFARIGALLEVQPLSVLQLWASYEVVGYFGSFNHLQSFPSPGADFSDGRLRSLEGYATGGSQLNLGATLQAKVGPVAARALFRMNLPRYDLRPGDRVFYEPFFDVLAPNGGWYLTNDTDLLYQTTSGWTAGLRWTVTHPLYAPNHYAPGDDTSVNPNGPMHRLGPLVAYTFFQREGAAYNAPTVLLVVNWWLAHRYRTGAEVSQAIPYVVLGFAFTGDLLCLPCQGDR